MRRTFIFENKPKAKEKILEDVEKHLEDVFPQDEITRIIVQSSSEFSVESDNIRKFYWGYVVPKFAQCMYNLTSEQMQSRNTKDKIHKKIKQLALPSNEVDVIENGQVVKRTQIPSMKGATVKQWYILIRSIVEVLDKDHGIYILPEEMGTEEGRDFSNLKAKYSKDKETEKDIAKTIENISKNLSVGKQGGIE